MHRTVVNFARFRDLFGAKFGRKSAPTTKTAAAEETAETEQPPTAEETETELDNILKARGVLKHLRPYAPPPDLERRLLTIVRNALPLTSSRKSDDPSALLNLSFAENGGSADGDDIKFQILAKAETTLGKQIPSSYLHELKTVNDLVEFYRIPVKNVTNYVELARSKDRPSNVLIAEEPTKFHPLIDGDSALPGVSRYVTDLRERQFDKGYRAKTAWHEYQDKHHDYTKPPPNCPWDKKKADRYDVNNFRLMPDFP